MQAPSFNLQYLVELECTKHIPPPPGLEMKGWSHLHLPVKLIAYNLLEQRAHLVVPTNNPELSDQDKATIAEACTLWKDMMTRLNRLGQDRPIAAKEAVPLIC